MPVAAAKPKTEVLDVWLAVDEEGDYAVGHDRSSAGERYDEEIGTSELGRRFVHLRMGVPLPTPLEVTEDMLIDETATVVAAIDPA